MELKGVQHRNQFRKNKVCMKKSMEINNKTQAYHINLEITRTVLNIRGKYSSDCMVCGDEC